jgi:hypothetical protein
VAAGGENVVVVVALSTVSRPSTVEADEKVSGLVEEVNGWVQEAAEVIEVIGVVEEVNGWVQEAAEVIEVIGVVEEAVAAP